MGWDGALRDGEFSFSCSEWVLQVTDGEMLQGKLGLLVHLKGLIQNKTIKIWIHIFYFNNRGLHL